MVMSYVDWGYGTVNMADVKAAGHTGICRYLSNSPAKNLSATERNAALAAGLDIVLVWETTAGRSTEGVAAGTTDGVTAAQQAATLGAPRGMTLYAATDSDTDWPTVAAYQRAFNTAVSRGGYRGDLYGGFRVIAGAVTVGASTGPWQTSAWSGGQIHPAAVLYQNNYHVPISGVDCDSSMVLRSVNGWHANLLKPAPKPAPKPPKEKEMTPADLKNIAALLHKVQTTVITHVREPLLVRAAEQDKRFDAIETKLAALEAAATNGKGFGE